MTTEKNKPSVFLTITQMEIGGAQKSAIGLAEQLEGAGYPVELCFFYDKGGLIPELKRAVRFPVIDLEAKKPEGGNLSLVWALRGLVRMYFRLRRSRAQVFVGFTPYSNILGGLVACAARVSVRIASQRNPLWGYPWWVWKLDGLWIKRGILHHLIAVSQEVKRFCVEQEDISENRVSVVQNGVDAAEFNGRGSDRHDSRERLGIEPDRLVIVCIGRLVAPKGFDVAIQALPQVKGTISDPLLLMVGEGPEADGLRRLANQLRVAGQVRFEGPVRDVRTHLSASDIFVLPSRWEGFPNTLLEAMASGLAAVASEVGGVVELIEHERSGLLVSPNDPEALAEAIVRLAGDDGLRSTLGAQARERVTRRFGRARSFEKFLDVMMGLLDQPQRA